MRLPPTDGRRLRRRSACEPVLVRADRAAGRARRRAVGHARRLLPPLPPRVPPPLVAELARPRRLRRRVLCRRDHERVAARLGLRVPAAAIGLVAGLPADRLAPAGGVGPEDRRRGAAPHRERSPNGARWRRGSPRSGRPLPAPAARRWWARAAPSRRSPAWRAPSPSCGTVSRSCSGRTFAGFALVLYGADQAAYFTLTFSPAGTQYARLPLLMSFDFLSTAVIGIALVSWLLQGERERLLQRWELARSREKAQDCVYRISEAARTVRDLPELFRLHPRDPARGPARPELLHRALRPPFGPARVPVLRRRARPDARAQAAGPGAHGVRAAHLPAAPRDAAGLREPAGAWRGRADRERLRRLAGGPAPWPRRADRGGGDPDVRPRGAARAGGARPVRVRLRADRRGDRGPPGRGRPSAERDAPAPRDRAGARRPVDHRRGAAHHLHARGRPRRARPHPRPGGGDADGRLPRPGERRPLPALARAARRVGELRPRDGRPLVHRARRAAARRPWRRPRHRRDRARRDEPAARRPCSARLGGAAAAGHQPRPPFHLREGRRRPLPPREPGGGRGVRHDRRPPHRPHRRRLRPLGGGGGDVPPRRPRGDAERATPA